MGWPDWLDEAEQIATRVDTCLEHMQPFERCRRGHIIRAALRDIWYALGGRA